MSEVKKQFEQTKHSIDEAFETIDEIKINLDDAREIRQEMKEIRGTIPRPKPVRDIARQRLSVNMPRIGLLRRRRMAPEHES